MTDFSNSKSKVFLGVCWKTLSHPSWQNKLKFYLKCQESMWHRHPVFVREMETGTFPSFLADLISFSVSKVAGKYVALISCLCEGNSKNKRKLIPQFYWQVWITQSNFEGGGGGDSKSCVKSNMCFEKYMTESCCSFLITETLFKHLPPY